MKCDVCVIGAGPAGMMAAISAAEKGAAVVLLEQNSVAGKKLLSTGKGRCNITHTGDIEHFVKAYGQFGRFLKHSLYEFSSDELRKYFAEHNLATKVEKDGCVFPLTDRATDINRILVDHARRMNIRFLCGKKVRSIRKQTPCFVITADKDTIFSYSLVIATGGLSWPHTGSTGDGFAFAEHFGHRIIAPLPALVPLVTHETWLGELTGVSLPHVTITAKPDGKKIAVEGPFIFTHDGIGGPAVLNLSRLLADYFAQPQIPPIVAIDDMALTPHIAVPILPPEPRIETTIDMFPDRQPQELEKQIIEFCAEHPKKELAGTLQPILPRALALALCKMLEPQANLLAGQLTKPNRRKLIDLLKKLTVHIKQPHPIAEAMVTRGGVDIAEIDPKTMQSKLCENLYFAGEVMNVDGPCGGYNLQAAFSTGRLAGISAAKIF